MSKGYKVWDVHSLKIIMSWDVTFDELSMDYSRAEINTSGPRSSNAAVPRGDSKEEVVGNIDLIPENSVEAENTKTDNSYNEFKDAQDDSSPPFRRSNRIRKQPGKWWVTKPSFYYHRHSLYGKRQPLTRSLPLLRTPTSGNLVSKGSMIF